MRGEEGRHEADTEAGDMGHCDLGGTGGAVDAGEQPAPFLPGGSAGHQYQCRGRRRPACGGRRPDSGGGDAGNCLSDHRGGSADPEWETPPQAAIETLHRPEAYSRTVTVEYLWTGGSGTIELSTAVSAPWTRVDRTLADGQVRHSITDGETTFIWYNGESEVYTGPAGAISADAEETIPTYEDVLALSPERIVQADYRVVSDVRCIYAETAEDAWGYAQRYWVSVDTGLLVVAERLQKGETVYRMAALEADQTAPPAETFTLPDGTDLLHR